MIKLKRQLLVYDDHTYEKQVDHKLNNLWFLFCKRAQSINSILIEFFKTMLHFKIWKICSHAIWKTGISITVTWFYFSDLRVTTKIIKYLRLEYCVVIRISIIWFAESSLFHTEFPILMNTYGIIWWISVWKRFCTRIVYLVDV